MPLIPVLEQKTIHDLLLVLDLAGTFVFAISGAMQGVRRNLDIFGILVLSFAASSALNRTSVSGESSCAFSVAVRLR